jgi:flagellar biosynthesis/type III secretory pathway chaperone|uniref:Flagellar protein FlgN n=1 Tax=Desulfobacca acetoxidans TaxID=60893 RepID=A0A7C3WIL7_9BACT
MKGTDPGVAQTAWVQQELTLYEELIDCLEEEAQALVNARAEAILAVAARKELLVDRLLELKRLQEKVPRPAPPEKLANLQRRVAAANARNRQIAAASLEVVQEFLARFQPPDPGLYHPARPAKASQDSALIKHRV